MPDIDISTAGVAKLLSNLNVSKAVGPESVRPIVLKELSQVITPVITIIFKTSLDSGTVLFLQTGKRPKFAPSSKKVIRQTQPTTARYHLHAYYSKQWSI